MMRVYPPHLACSVEGLNLLNMGKVRNTYEVPGRPDLLAVYATDRGSVFDIVLGTLFPQKGEILNAMTVYWKLWFAEKHGIVHDLVAWGIEIDEFLPRSLRKRSDLWKRMVIVRKARMLLCEPITRLHLLGSAFRAYDAETGILWDHKLLPRLRPGERLADYIFTPSTKAKVGHDEPMTYAQLCDLVGKRRAARLREKTLLLHRSLNEVAVAGDLIIGDFKCEWGLDPETGKLILCDEIGTPDVMRCFGPKEYDRALEAGVFPETLDKEYLRVEARKQETHKLNPENPEDVARGLSTTIPSEVVGNTIARYRMCLRMLLSTDLEGLQHTTLQLPL